MEQQCGTYVIVAVAYALFSVVGTQVEIADPLVVQMYRCNPTDYHGLTINIPDWPGSQC